MTKNLKKAVKLLRSGHPITDARFPTNYERAMTKVYGRETGVFKEEPMTEQEFHNEHSVEKLETE